jgi:hypothetical protein
MLEAIKAGWNVLHAGECVANPALYKTHQVSANAIGVFLLALATALKVFFNIEVPIDEASALKIGGGILAIINIVLTMATTDKIGLPSKSVPAGKASAGDEYADADKPRNDRVDYGGGN